jgi:hypothetical protein
LAFVPHDARVPVVPFAVVPLHGFPPFGWRAPLGRELLVAVWAQRGHALAGEILNRHRAMVKACRQQRAKIHHQRLLRFL